MLFFTQPRDGIVLGGTWAGCKLHDFKRPVSRWVEDFDVVLAIQRLGYRQVAKQDHLYIELYPYRTLGQNQFRTNR